MPNYNDITFRSETSLLYSREYVLNKMLPEMKYLASQYEPDVWWSDGDWEAKPEYWGSKDFLAWLYNESPTKNTVVSNDRYVAYSYVLNRTKS